MQEGNSAELIFLKRNKSRLDAKRKDYNSPITASLLPLFILESRNQFRGKPCRRQDAVTFDRPVIV